MREKIKQFLRLRPLEINLLKTLLVNMFHKEGQGIIIVYSGLKYLIHGKIVCSQGSILLLNRPNYKQVISKGYLIIERGGRLVVEGRFRFLQGMKALITEGAILNVKSGYFSRDVEIRVRKSITILGDIAVGPDVLIRDSDDHVINNKVDNMVKEIVIGNHVWIGSRAIILKGVQIGNGSVIAAGTVVTKNVPDNTLFAGVPGIVKKDEIRWM